MTETCDIPSLKKEVRRYYRLAFIIACYSAFSLYIDYGHQQPLAPTIFISSLMELSLCWCIKKTNDTIKNGGVDPDGPFELKFKTQFRARLALVGVFLCGMLSFAYIIICFAELSTNYNYGLVGFVVSGFLMLKIYADNDGIF
ncbi:MAG: hypothetical protein ACM3RX_07465 [Methanococcaceae archaeon]